MTFFSFCLGNYIAHNFQCCMLMQISTMYLSGTEEPTPMLEALSKEKKWNLEYLEWLKMLFPALCNSSYKPFSKHFGLNFLAPILNQLIIAEMWKLHIRVPEYVCELLFYKIHIKNKGKSAFLHKQVNIYFCRLTLKKLYILCITYARTQFVNPLRKNSFVSCILWPQFTFKFYFFIYMT